MGRGEVPFRKYDDLLYEYNCHEGNYAMSNILSGARYQERLAGGNWARPTSRRGLEVDGVEAPLPKRPSLSSFSD